MRTLAKTKETEFFIGKKIFWDVIYSKTLTLLVVAGIVKLINILFSHDGFM